MPSPQQRAKTRRTRARYDCYAVKKGRSIGVFKSWKETHESVVGYSGCLYKGFSNIEEAKKFLCDDNAINVSARNNSSSSRNSELEHHDCTRTNYINSSCKTQTQLLYDQIMKINGSKNTKISLESSMDSIDKMFDTANNTFLSSTLIEQPGNFSTSEQPKLHVDSTPVINHHSTAENKVLNFDSNATPSA